VHSQVRDGGGPYAELIGQFCGTSVPSPMISTSNKLWIRFYTDGTSEGAGAAATLNSIDGKKFYIHFINDIILYFIVQNKVCA